jgi:ferredoxin
MVSFTLRPSFLYSTCVKVCSACRTTLTTDPANYMTKLSDSAIHQKNADLNCTAATGYKLA